MPGPLLASLTILYPQTEQLSTIFRHVSRGKICLLAKTFPLRHLGHFIRTMLGNSAGLLSDIHLSISAAKVATLFGYKDGDVDEVTYLIDGLSPDYISYSFMSVTS